MTRRHRLTAAAALGLALYTAGALPGNAQGASCAAAKPVADRIRPLVKGEIAGVLVSEKQQALPNLAFQSPEGKLMTLADLKGRMVLLNLWATWCAPCRKEMPALDKLQAELGGADFEVVAVNIDQRNLDRPKTFLTEIGVTKLGYYADPSARVFQQLRSTARLACRRRSLSTRTAANWHIWRARRNGPATRRRHSSGRRLSARAEDLPLCCP
jgi:thiol-disulfide isomerase/thioredoxin